MTLLAELVSTSARVGGTSSRLTKVRELAALLGRLRREEIEIGVSYLAGGLPQGRIGVGYAALQASAAAAGPASTGATLSVEQTDRHIADPAMLRNSDAQSPVLEHAMSKQHQYAVSTAWTGNDGAGTQSYRSYRRDHVITAAGKPPIPGSSDPAFRGDRTRYNPEELLVASLSSCHMLWYLHLCAVNGIVVIDYRDEALGTMQEEDDGGGTFVRVVLKPRVTIAKGGDRDKALALHAEAHHLCFIARAVRFPVDVAPEVTA